MGLPSILKMMYVRRAPRLSNLSSDAFVRSLQKALLSTSAHNTSSIIVKVNNERSKSEIQKLVHRRVKERDGWKVNEAFPGPLSLSEIFRFVGRHLPKIMSFQPPSTAWLDEHFSLLPMDWKQIQNPDPAKIQITWLGHASLLVQMDGCNIITDPVFSERCSPSQWFGPKRYRPPPCTVDDICERLNFNTSDNVGKIDLILISHNHYDHLDHATVTKFCQLSPDTRFVVPLGLRAWFREHVCTQINIYEKDWHESIEYKYHTNRGNDKDSDAIIPDTERSLRVQCIPMRHWSNRVGDRDQTLWCGYSLTGSVTGSEKDETGKITARKFLFPGDTAWFDGLKDLGAKYGPWTVAAIPIGAYEPRDFMKTNHIDVAEAIRMKDAVEAKAAVPIHWGTFPVTIEPVMEPRERLLQCMKERPDASTFTPWQIGETKLFD